MKIRFLAIAVLGLLLGGTACGSDDHDGTTLASGSSASAPTTTVIPPTTAPPAAADVSTPTLPATPDPTPAASSDAPAVGQLAPSAPQQTLTTLPEKAFTVTYQGVSYYCEPHSLFDDKRNDCVRYYGGAAPLMLGKPELYCSYSARPECSKQWYPAELEDADLVTIGGQTYVCRLAVLGGNIGDKDCGRYTGGDPDSVSVAFGLKCSPDLDSLQCDDKYYPSEMEGLTQVRIGYSDYLCTTGYGSKKCWKWSSYESPKQATIGTPDLYCNSSGTCAEDGYPSGY